jgi:hypothetical protein
MNPKGAPNQLVLRVLVLGAFMEFLGHGVLGMIRVAAWARYFGVVGIRPDTASALMPLVGLFDVSMALAAVIYPMRAAILYMAAWGLWTALLRPLSGESFWEAVERAGNFGALYALFLLARGGGLRSWLGFEPVGGLDARLRSRVGWVLRTTTVLLLLGHGILGLAVRKPLFVQQYAAIGIHGAWAEPLVGGFECVLALAVLARPGSGLLYFVVAWKLATEALSPAAGSTIWVFVEHGGSYAAPLALALLQRQPEAASDGARGGADPGMADSGPLGSRGRAFATAIAAESPCDRS